MVSKEDIKLLEIFFPYWSNIKQNDKAKIILSSKIFSLKKNSICSLSSEIAGLIFLKSGKLRFFLASPEERDLPLYILNPSEVDFFDLTITEPISFIEFIAEENSEILLIPFSTLQIFREKYNFLENYLHNLTKNKFSKSLLAMQNIIFISLKTRLLNFLYSLNETTIILTHEEIAKKLGSSREVITRILKQLEKEKILIVERKKIILKNI